MPRILIEKSLQTISATWLPGRRSQCKPRPDLPGPPALICRSLAPPRGAPTHPCQDPNLHSVAHWTLKPLQWGLAITWELSAGKSALATPTQLPETGPRAGEDFLAKG